MVVVFLFTKPMVTLLARTKFFGQGHSCPGWTRPGWAPIAVARHQAPGRPGQPAAGRCRRRLGQPARTNPKEA